MKPEQFYLFILNELSINLVKESNMKLSPILKRNNNDSNKNFVIP